MFIYVHTNIHTSKHIRKTQHIQCIIIIIITMMMTLIRRWSTFKKCINFKCFHTLQVTTHTHTHSYVHMYIRSLTIYYYRMFFFFITKEIKIQLNVWIRRISRQNLKVFRGKIFSIKCAYVQFTCLFIRK